MELLKTLFQWVRNSAGLLSVKKFFKLRELDWVAAHCTVQYRLAFTSFFNTTTVIVASWGYHKKLATDKGKSHSFKIVNVIKFISRNWIQLHCTIVALRSDYTIDLITIWSLKVSIFSTFDCSLFILNFTCAGLFLFHQQSGKMPTWFIRD